MEVQTIGRIMIEVVDGRVDRWMETEREWHCWFHYGTGAGSLPASREETKEKAKSKPKWTRETCIQAIFLCPSSITCLFISAVGYSPNSLGSEVRRPVFEQLSHLVWL